MNPNSKNMPMNFANVFVSIICDIIFSAIIILLVVLLRLITLLFRGSIALLRFTLRALKWTIRKSIDYYKLYAVQKSEESLQNKIFDQ